MKTTERRDKIVAGVSTALFFVALTGIIIIHDSNQSLEDLLSGARLKSESLLSEKLALNKEIGQYKNQLASYQGKNQDLDKRLAAANADIARMEKELKGLKDNPRSRALERELADAKKNRSALETQIADLNDNLRKLQGTNSDLITQVASLTAKNKDLTTSNEVMKAFASNNYSVEATRGKNDRLTVVAKRTKRMKVGFDLPQSVAENVKFKVKTPDGRVVEKEEEGLSSILLDAEDGSDLMVSLAPIDGLEVTKRIEMKYEPKKKLAKGVYTIDIYNGSTYMVSCQMKLR